VNFEWVSEIDFVLIDRDKSHSTNILVEHLGSMHLDFFVFKILNWSIIKKVRKLRKLENTVSNETLWVFLRIDIYYEFEN
jgi:hypothetical protein